MESVERKLDLIMAALEILVQNMHDKEAILEKSSKTIDTIESIFSGDKLSIFTKVLSGSISDDEDELPLLSITNRFE